MLRIIEVLKYINSEQGTHYTLTTIGDHYGTKGRTSTAQTGTTPG